MDTLADAPHSALSGVARVLVHAGKLNSKTAEELVRAAREKRTSFVASVINAGSVSSAELAHTLSTALALPLLDLSAIDATKLPRNVIEGKLASQYQVVVLGKRGNRLFIGGADPTDQEAAERIKLLTTDNAQLRAELGAIKDRLQNVERIVTDKPSKLAREIDALAHDQEGHA